VERCDAVVVGGGPAGSSCAHDLVRAGLNVIVLDRARFPRDKTCAGWITPAVVEALALPLDEYRRGRVCEAFRGFRTRVAGGREVVTRFDAPVSYGIVRAEFDDYLLRRSGARLQLGTELASLRRSGDRWMVNERIETPIVVGAGGHFCPVARWLGARPADETAIAAQEFEGRLSPEQAERCRVAADEPYLELCRDLRGYGWCVRKGDHLNIGLGRQDRHDLHGFVGRFFEGLVASGRVPPSLPVRWKGHAYLLRDASVRHAVGDGLLLVGDAAGLASAFSGEGIRPAVESGRLAAATIIAARERYDERALRPYADGLADRYPRSTATVGSSLPRGLVVPIVDRLLGTSWFTRRILLDRWFLSRAA